MVNTITHSAQALWFYNRCQIVRMKINKNQSISDEPEVACPEFYIEEVINPFTQQILARKQRFYIAKEEGMEAKIKLDWKNYQLILFNIV